MDGCFKHIVRDTCYPFVCQPDDRAPTQPLTYWLINYLHLDCISTVSLDTIASHYARKRVIVSAKLQ